MAITALSLALVLVGNENWPDQSYRNVLFVTLLFGVIYAIFSEWLDVTVRGSRAYAPDMPVVPVLGIGPLLQFRFGSRLADPAHCDPVRCFAQSGHYGL